MTTPIASAPSPFGAAPAKSPREQLKEASKQFEAIFVRQMLAAARKTNFDEDGLFKSQALDTFDVDLVVGGKGGNQGNPYAAQVEVARHGHQGTRPSPFGSRGKGWARVPSPRCRWPWSSC